MAEWPTETENEEEEGKGRVDPMEKMDALFQELEAVKRQNSDLRKDVLRLSLIGPAGEDEEPGIPEVNMEGLPDLYSDEDGWRREYARRVAEAARSQPAKKPQRNVDELWNQFRTSHPELAANPEMVEVAVKKAMAKGEARGYDMQRYMFGHPEMFFEDIVDEHTRIFGGAAAGAKGQEKASAPEAKAEDADETAEPVWGIFGAHNPVSKRKGGEEESLGSLSGDLKDLQRKAGLAW